VATERSGTSCLVIPRTPRRVIHTMQQWKPKHPVLSTPGRLQRQSCFLGRWWWRELNPTCRGTYTQSMTLEVVLTFEGPLICLVQCHSNLPGFRETRQQIQPSTGRSQLLSELRHT
jgi:hypothetical protein